MKASPHIAPATIASVGGVLACVIAVTVNSIGGVGVAVLVHGISAYLSLRAAHFRKDGPLSESEYDAVLYTAVLVPLMGPMLAWSLPAKCADPNVENAHEVLVRYAAHVQPGIPDYERTLFTGDHDRDLSRELEAESFYEVLRDGDTTQKRNALRALAQCGKPHHLQMIRKCLVDDDLDVRLYAYGELERLTKGFEERISGSQKRLVAGDPEGDARLALARAHFELAGSGILDPKMAGFHYRGAESHAREATTVRANDPVPYLLEILALARRGEVDLAAERVGELPEGVDATDEAAVVRAEVAFLRRDYETARAEVPALRAGGFDIPDWLLALEPPMAFEEPETAGAEFDETVDLSDFRTPEQKYADATDPEQSSTGDSVIDDALPDIFRATEDDLGDDTGTVDNESLIPDSFPPDGWPDDEISDDDETDDLDWRNT